MLKLKQSTFGVNEILQERQDKYQVISSKGEQTIICFKLFFQETRKQAENIGTLFSILAIHGQTPLLIVSENKYSNFKPFTPRVSYGEILTSESVDESYSILQN